MNLRNEGEPEQPIGTPPRRARRPTPLGLRLHPYGRRLGATPGAIWTSDAVCDFIDEPPSRSRKVLVHCRKGGRAAAVVLLYEALKEGWAPSEAPAKGRAMGLEVDGGLRTMVETYLDDHRKIDS